MSSVDEDQQENSSDDGDEEAAPIFAPTPGVHSSEPAPSEEEENEGWEDVVYKPVATDRDAPRNPQRELRRMRSQQIWVGALRSYAAGLGVRLVVCLANSCLGAWRARESPSTAGAVLCDG